MTGNPVKGAAQRRGDAMAIYEAMFWPNMRFVSRAATNRSR